MEKNAMDMNHDEYQVAKANILASSHHDTLVKFDSPDVPGPPSDTTTNQIETLRLDCLKAAGDPDKVCCAKRYLDRREVAANSKRYAVNVIQNHVEETNNGAVFTISLDIDVYATDERIEHDLKEQVFSKISQYRAFRDSRSVHEMKSPPVPQRKKGQRSVKSEIEYYNEGLKAIELQNSGKTLVEAGEELFGIARKMKDQDSQKQKTAQRVRKAKTLIGTAIDGKFKL